MKKVWSVFLIILMAAACMLNGCGQSNDQTDQEDGNLLEKESVVNTSDVLMENNDLDNSYPEEDNTSAVWESEFGYSMTYDPTVFTVDDTTDIDVFSYNTAESMEAPVYISVQKYSDMDAQTLADGIVLQSGMDGTEALDTYFGAGSLAAKCVYMEQDINGVKQIQIFYAIPIESGSLLVEIGSYIGAPLNVDSKLEEMLGTFTLK